MLRKARKVLSSGEAKRTRSLAALACNSYGKRFFFVEQFQQRGQKFCKGRNIERGRDGATTTAMATATEESQRVRARVRERLRGESENERETESETESERELRVTVYF